MKKTYFKKAISLIMTVIMIMSCWVWVAPQKAEAATAGNYKVRITWQVNNTKNYSNSFTGTETEDGARAGLILYYKSNNGSGTQSSMYWCLDSTNYGGTYVSAEKSTGNTNSATGTNYYCVATIAGFPTALYAMADSDNFTDKGQYTVSKIEVYNNTTSAYDTLWAGKGWTDTSTEKKWFKITADGDGTVTTTGNDSDNGYASTSTETWNFPTPTTATTWSGVSAMTCPKTGTATQDVELVVNDQYGVEMFNPTWSVKGSVCGTTDISVDPSTSSQTTTIKLTNAANVSSTTDTQTGTITATWGTLGSLSETFTITDSYYTATFNYKSAAGADTSATRNGYHGDTITAPTAPEWDLDDYHYTFSAWSPAFASTITKDVTYNATYTSAFVEADYTGVNDAIATADAIKAQYGTEYELKYTLASRVALDDAIDAVVTGLGRTQQDVVDGYAQAINDAIAALEPNKFDVIFLDRFGAILLYEKNAEYKEAVTAPEFPEDQKVYYDADNHYTYTGWDNDEYLSVIDDLVINPVYTAQAHTFETSTVVSNCVTKGATKYTCTVCGYSYVDGQTDYGDHVWEADYTIDLYPTCTVAGSKSIHCTLCDAQKDITAIDPLGHNWASQSVAVEATCGKIGIATRICDDCGVCEHTIIDALEHDYAETVVAPTCTAKGYTEYVCQRTDCGFSYRDSYTDVTAHNFGDWETVYKAVCEVEGLEKRVCTDCGFMELQTTAALSHVTPDTWTVITNATCTGTGYQVKSCTLCGLLMESEVTDELGHAYSVTSETTATCTEAGVKTETCSRCGDVNKTVTQPTGHTYDSGVHSDKSCNKVGFTTYTCTACSHSYIEFDDGAETTGHDFSGTETVVTAATCTADGEKTVQCKNDGCQVTTNVVIPKTGHSMKAGTAVDAACTTSGYVPYTCENADCTYTYNVYDETAPAKGHSFEETGRADASCTVDGSVSYKCENCTETKTEVIPATGHNYVKGTVSEATCTTPATEVYTCDCGDTYTKYISASNGHTWGEWTEIQAPTADEYGIKKRVCSVCGAEELGTVAPIGDHVFSESVTKAPTCTAEGEKSYTCSVHTDCSANYTETIPALGHTEKLVYIAPTCTNEGTVKIACETCGTDIGTTQTIPVAAHSYGSGTVTTPATCTSDGVMSYTCSACGAQRTEVIAKTGHTLSSAYNPASCTTAGSVVTSCSNGDYTTTQEIPATGHKLTVTVVDATCEAEGSVTEKCTACDYVNVTAVAAKNHTYTGTETVITDAACEADGEKTVQCAACNETVTVVIPKLGHSWGKYETTAATCTTDGKKVAECINDSCQATNEIILPKTGHNWSEWVKVDATNDTDGSWTRTCANDSTHVETVVIPKGGHTFGDTPDTTTSATCTTEGEATYNCTAHADCGVTITVKLAVTQHTVATRETPATCTAEGKVEAYCSICNTVFSTETTDKIAHVYTAGTAVVPTCTTNGYTPYTCKCGDTYNVYDASKPATGHSFVEGASTASCTGEGLMTLTCETCQYSETVEVPALGHDYVEDTAAETSATCAAAATKTYKCSRCDASYTISVGDKTKAHSYPDNWTTVESATESSIGYKTRECSVCGQLEVAKIDATGEHSFVNGEITDSKSATCTENGYEIRKCENHTDCGETTTITLFATGHTETLVYTAATCTAAGSTKIVCETCTEALDEETIPALGHLWSEGTVTSAICITAGKVEYTCTRTDCTATKETVIPRDFNSHDYVTTITQPSCTKTGSIVTKCTRTGCPSNPVNETLPMTDHSWGTPTVTDATCEADGSEVYTCQACTATKTVVIPKTGHTWGDWEVTTQSTNTAEGVLTRECANGCKEEVKFPAGGHNLVGTETKSASCTETGTVLYACDAHTDCGVSVEVTIPVKQHEFETTKKDATCEGEGEVITKCKNCDTATITTVIPATGHTYDDGVQTDATCEAEGKIVYTCTVAACGETKEVVLTKLQHNYVAGTPEAPTCTASGYTPYKCATCTSEYVIITAPANGHKYDTPISSTATCLTAGAMTLKCTCGAEIVTDVPALGHDYQQASTTEATCADEATETYECSRCADSYTVSVGSKTENHSYPATWTVVEPATESSIGYESRECTVCGKLEVRTIEATGEHNFTNGEITDSKPATCTENGYEIRKCTTHTDCGMTATITLTKLGHSEELKYTAATCSQSGTANITCKTCSEVLDEETIPALEHAWGDETITLSDCTNKGKVEFTCSRSGCTETKTVELYVNEDAHTLKTTVNPATCTDEGSVVLSCEKCNKTLNTTEIPVISHTWGEWTVTKAATNTADGEMTRTCSKGCTEKATIPMGGHAFGNTPDTTTPATCTQEGTATYKCTVHADCGVEITVTLDKTQHNLTTTTTDAICEGEGSVVTKCKNCDTVNETTVLPAIGHSFGDWTDTGSDDVHTRTCARCSETETQAHKWDDGKVTVEPSYDNPGQTLYTCYICSATKTEGIDVDVDANAPTGKIKWDATVWNDFLSVITFGIYVNYDVELEITAEDAGTGVKSIEYYVSDKALTLDEVKALASWISYDSANKLTVNAVDAEKIVVYAKITDNAGNETYISSDGIVFDTVAPVLSIQADKGNALTNVYCSSVIVIIDDANISHAIFDGKTVALTTDKFYCNEIGAHTLEVFDKAGNSDVITFTINDGHTWANAPLADNSNLKDAATCEDKAVYYAACGVCGEISSETFEYGNALSHDYKGTVTTAATCTQDGVMTYVCQNDNSHTYTESIPATGHTELPAKEENRTEAKCEADGSYDMVVYCENCGEVLGRETFVIPATGHNYVGAVTKAPTCTEEGVMTYTCANDRSHAYSEEIPALGHTDDNYDCTCEVCGEKCCLDSDLYVRVIEPGCTKKGYSVLACKNCAREDKTEIAALGHKEVVTYVEATCSQYAHKIVTCANCDELNELIYTDNAYAAHSLVIIPAKPATCVSDGYTAYERCVNCGTVTEAQTLYKEDVPHVDADGNSKCDTCDGEYFSSSKACSCLCHGTGIKAFLYKIALFFWKLFKMSKSCGCGAVHY